MNLGGAGATIPFAAEVLGVTGSVISGSNTVAVSSTNGLAVGQVVCGNGVGGLKITAISPGSITMSSTAWATIPSDALTFVSTSNTAINGNVLVLNEVTADSALTLVNGLDLTGAGRQINVNANTAIVSGTIVNSGGATAALTKGGAGTLALTAANTYDGGTTVSTGTLQLGNGGTTGSVAGNIANAATLVFNRSDSGLVLAGTISGAGGVVQAGPGLTLLATANTYTGSTTVSSGTLQIGNGGTDGAIGATSGIAVASGATLAFNRTDDYGGSFSRVISGSGSVALASGSLTLAGANTFSGDTVLNGGTLIIGIATALQNSTLNYNNQGGTFSFGTLTAATLGSLKGAQNLALLNASGTGVNLSVGNNGASTIYTGLITGTNSASTLTKVGTGTLTLDPGAAVSGTVTSIAANGGILTLASGTNTTMGLIVGGTGTLNLTAGTLNSNESYPHVNGTMNVSGGTFNAGTAELLMAFNNSGAVLNLSGSGVVFANQIRLGQGPANSNASTLNLNGGTLQMQYLNGTGNTLGVVNLNGGTLKPRGAQADFLNSKSTYNVLAGGAIFDTAGYNITVQAPLLSGTAGDGGLTKNGAGTLTLSGSNSYTGATSINAGTLALAGSNALAGGGAIAFGGGTLQFSGSNTNDYSGRIVNSGSAVALDTNGQGVTFSVPLAGTNTGGLSKLGAGTLTLAGSNAYSGATTVSSGTLQINGVLGLGSYAGAISNAGALIFASSASQVLSGGISGAGSLSQSGAGTLTLTGLNSYTGATTVNGGTLQIGDGTSGSLAAASALTINGSATLAVNLPNGGTIGSYITTLAGSTINALASGTNTFSNNIIGAGSFNQMGSGLTIFNATGSFTYAGATNITNGMLQLNTGLLYSTVNLAVNNGLGFGVNAVSLGGLTGNASIALMNGTNGVTLSVGTNNNDTTYTGALSGSNGATLVKTGAGTLTYAPVTSCTINSLTVNQGKLLLTGGTLTAPTFRVSGTGVFEQTGGILSSNPYPSISGVGGATLNVLGGTFQGATELLIGFGTGVPGTVNVSGSGTLSAFWLRMGDGSNATVNLSTGGTLQTARFYTQSGGSTLNMDGGTIRVITQARADFLQGLGAAYINTGGVTFDTNGFSSTAAQPLQTGIGLPGNDGGLIKIGAGTLTLSGSNTYNGGTTVSNGTLQLGSANALGAATGNLTVNGGTLDLNGNSVTVGSLSGSAGAVITTASNASVTMVVGGSNSCTYAGIVQNGSGTVSLSQAGTGNLTLAGANTYTGDTTLNSGTLTLGTATTLQNSTLNYQGGTLSFGTLTAATLGGLKGAQSLSLLSTSGTGVALTVGGNNQSTTYTGVLSGTDAASAFSKAGTGTLILDPGASTGAAIHSVAVLAGTLSVASSTLNVTAAVTSGLDVNGGVLEINGGIVNTIGNPTIRHGGSVILNSGTFTNTGEVLGGYGTSGTFTLNGGLADIATFRVAQNANSAQTGVLNLNGGTMRLDLFYVANVGTGTNALNFNGATVQAKSNQGVFIATALNAVVQSGGAIFDTAGNDITISASLVSGAISDGGLSKLGGGTLTLAGSNSYNGGINVNGGTLNVNADQALGATTGSLTINDGAILQTSGSFAFDASRNVILSGSATVDTQGNTNTISGLISGSAATLVKQGSGTLILSGSLSMAGLNASNGVTQLAQSGSIGAVTIADGASVVMAAHTGSTYNLLDVSSLTLSGSTSTLDLWNNAMVLRASGTSENAANLAMVKAAVNAASNGLRWNGTGLGSTTAFNEAQTGKTQALALMVYDNRIITQSSFEGVSGLGYFDDSNSPVGFDQVLVKLTYLGDFNADGLVNASDYTWLDGFALSGSLLGDLNGDGMVNATDYTWLDGSALNQSFGVLAARPGSGSGGSALQAPASAAAIASPEAVPEPGTWALLVSGAGLAFARRLRRRSSIP